MNKSLQCVAFAATHTGCPRTSHPGATSELMGHCLSLISEPLRHDGLHASPTSPTFQRQGHQLLPPCCSMVHLAHAHPVSRACDESQTSVSDHWMPKANKAKGKGTSWIFQSQVLSQIFSEFCQLSPSFLFLESCSQYGHSNTKYVLILKCYISCNSPDKNLLGGSIP